ncbi:MAG TPA: leucine-rich repeat protein [Bacillota bacterium]|nr:leucine-rich repeat protein [Bacillota bacterium]
MLKRSLVAFLAVIILFSAIPIVALARDSDFVISNNVLVRYNGSGGTVTVPNGVTSIGESAFANFSSVNTVKLPNSVTSIKQSAFSCCINLKAITLSSNLIDIADYAFEFCTSLESITIPASVKNIGLAAFARCTSLTAIKTDATNPYFSTISGVLFNKNGSTLVSYPAGQKASSYTIPNGTTTIGPYAFTWCSNLTTAVIPSSVTIISESAFDSCRKLTSITIPNTVKSIGKSAFSYSGLTSITIPDSITSIADWTFNLCASMTQVTIPNSVTDIGNAAFQGCSVLTSITIPNSVTSIGWEAFNTCPSLTEIIIPNSVQSIGNGAFYGSGNVTIYGIKDSYAHQYAKKNYIKSAEYTFKDDGSISLDPSTVAQTQPQPVDTTFNGARILNKLGLFNGVGTDAQGNPIFDLNRQPTRQEALVMLIRLLGLEKTALASTKKHPFDDVDAWAAPYVGYAYSIGLTNGVSPNKFGGNNLVTLQQYSVFLLRALGYSEKDNDFTYSAVFDKAYALGIINSKDATSFTRGNVAELSYNILLLSPKGEERKLANKLLWDDVFTTDQLDETHDGKLMLAADMPDLITNGVIVYNLEDLRALILLSMKNNQLGIGIYVPGFSKDKLEKVYDDIIKSYHRKAILAPSVTCRDSYIYPHIMISDYLKMEYYYENPARYQKSYKFYRTDLIIYSGVTVTLAGLAKKVDSIVEKNTTSEMSQKQKVKALHGYLILNTWYDRAAEGSLTMSPHFAKQIIFENYGVCDGYSEAFKILLNAAGIECKVIYGDTPYGLHAWNQVKIDGIWYNVDITWDDPDDGSKILYDYFCVSDKKFLKDHYKIEDICEPAACPNTLE